MDVPKRARGATVGGSDGAIAFSQRGEGDDDAWGR